MATVIQRGNIFHIQYFDPVKKKTNSMSTGLPINESNYKKAEKFAEKFQLELTKKSKELRKIGIRHITLQETFEHFLENNQNKHPKTILDYHRFYKKFSETFDPNKPAALIDKISVERWLNEIKKLPLAKNTIHGYGKQLVHFLNFLFEYSYTQMFKINREVRTRPEIKEKITFKDEDIIKIFDNLDTKNSNFTMAVYLLFYTGLRSSDVLTITADHIDFGEQKISYYSPKRKVYREVAFHDDLIPIFRARIKEIKEGLLLTYHKVESLGQVITRYFKTIGLTDKHYTARTFRKTFITLCRSRYEMDATIVRELVGHEHANTTDRYYNQISVRRMKEELGKFKRPS